MNPEPGRNDAFAPGPNGPRPTESAPSPNPHTPPPPSTTPNAAAPPEASDPRLEIPEILRKPINHPSRNRPAKPPALAGLGDLGKALAIGLDFLFSIVAGGVLGWLIDRWLNSSPAGILIGIVAGFGGGTFRMLKRLNAPDPVAKRPSDDRRSPRPPN